MRGVVFAGVVAGSFILSSGAQALTEDFESLPSTGNLVGQSILDGHGTLTSSNRTLRVYNTSPPVGEDGDLEYANSGQALIFQQNGSATSAPNDHRDGGTLTITFNKAIDLLELTIFDFEQGEQISFTSDKGLIGSATGTASDAGGTTQTAAATRTFDFANFGNTGFSQGITSLTIATDASTAFDNLVATPIPGAALLFGSALAGLGLYGRRRARNAAAA